MRTRIKICGLTREADVVAAATSGADAVGFNCYPKSPRYVMPARLRVLAGAVTPFVTPVLLFVNASADLVEDAIASVPDAMLQFHGDEPEAACSRYGRPYLRAVHMAEGVDLLDWQARYPSAVALLADTPSAASGVYGGSGRSFDWSRAATPPGMLIRPLILAGGLTAASVGEAIARIRPYAVDVSSSVEESPGHKSAARINEFIAAVRAADEALSITA